MATTQDRINGLLGDLGVKPPVLVATTAPITLSGEQTIDGVAIVAGNRVLVKDQVDQKTNGIYYCQLTTWVRAPDFDGVRDALYGTLVFVASGTVNSASMWNLTTLVPVIGTSNITFSRDVGLTASAFIQTLLDDTTAAAARTTLGAVGLTGNETIVGNKTFSGVTGVGSRVTAVDAAAGQMGEYISSTVLVGSAVSLTSGIQANVTSIVLTPGDWDVHGNVMFKPGATTSVTYEDASISATSAVVDEAARNPITHAAIVAGATPSGRTIPSIRYSVGVSTTVFLVAVSGFTISTQTAYGRLWARRV